MRALFFVAEWLLRRRTDCLVACARREEQLGRRLGYATTYYVPNRAGVAPRGTARRGTGRASIIGVGRLSGQKDPSCFAAVARAAVGADDADEVHLRWVGDGSPDLRSEMESAGVAQRVDGMHQGRVPAVRAGLLGVIRRREGQVAAGRTPDHVKAAHPIEQPEIDRRRRRSRQHSDDRDRENLFNLHVRQPPAHF